MLNDHDNFPKPSDDEFLALDDVPESPASGWALTILALVAIVLAIALIGG